MRYLALVLLVPITVMAQPPVIVTPSTTTPTTVITPSGTYIIVPDYTNGSVKAVIKTSKGK